MTPKTEKFYKVHLYLILWFLFLIDSVVLSISGDRDGSVHFSILSFISLAIACIRGDILEMQRSKK